MSVNSAARRCATSRAPSSTTTAPMTARLTYSSSSTGATLFSAAMNGDRIEGIWVAIDTKTELRIPGVINVVPEETRLVMLASTAPTWPAVSPLSAAV